MKSFIVVSILLLSSMSSMMANAESPWECLNREENNLKLPAYVKFWYGDHGITEGYAFDTDDNHPFGKRESIVTFRLSPLGSLLHDTINYCGCTDSLDLWAEPNHIEGLCLK